MRDLLLGRAPRELDVVVLEDPEPLLAALADGVVHARFGTAAATLGSVRVDVARACTSATRCLGRCPRSRRRGWTQDLLRRDFTVNAMAVWLAGPRAGVLEQAPYALEDLRARRLRVQHEHSFRDDPTRLLRLGRYGARLGFTPEPATAALARRALAGGALATISGARIGAELRLALGECDASAALAELGRNGVLAGIHPRLRFDERAARSALGLLASQPDGQPAALLLAVLVLALTLRVDEDPGGEARALLDRLQFGAGAREQALAAALAMPRLVEALSAATTRSGLRAAVADATPEAVAVAGVLGDSQARAAALQWLTEVRHIRLRITGDDLLAAGVPEGPELGALLELTLAQRLDGQLADAREPQLQAALRTRR